MAEKKELTVAEVIPAADSASRPMDVTMMRQQAGAVLTLLETTLVVDVHYGKIPGTKKPTLYQPGAEKIAMMFRLRPTYEVVESTQQHDGGPTGLGFISYTVRCTLHHGDVVVGEALGNCNSRERKYLERQVYPNKASKWEIDHGRKEEKVGRDGPYTVYVVPVDPWEILQTIISMAQKRAFIRAVRAATAASDLLDVDADMVDTLRAESAAAAVAPEDAAAGEKLRAETAEAQLNNDLLTQAADLARKWCESLGKTGEQFASLVQLSSGGRTDNPVDLQAPELQQLIDTMNGDIKATEDRPF